MPEIPSRTGAANAIGHIGELPDLSQLPRTNFPDRLLNMVFGMGGYPEPTQFQLTTAVRLLDKALGDWDAARTAFADHAGTRDGLAPALRPKRPGITRALFRAIGHLEDFIDSLARALRLVDAMRASPDLGQFAAMPQPTAADWESVRMFRNRIAHGDEDIADGKAGQGLATATLEPGQRGIQIQGRRLEYDDLARMVEMLCDYLRAASEKKP